jgi:hypothetical protein
MAGYSNIANQYNPFIGALEFVNQGSQGFKAILHMERAESGGLPRENRPSVTRARAAMKLYDPGMRTILHPFKANRPELARSAIIKVAHAGLYGFR